MADLNWCDAIIHSLKGRSFAESSGSQGTYGGFRIPEA